MTDESTSLVGNSLNNDDQNENKRDNPVGATGLLSQNENSVDSLPLAADALKSSTKSNSRLELGCQPNSKNNISVLNDGSNFQATSLGSDSMKSVIFENVENKKMQALSKPKVKNIGESSDDFSRTFMLDEELELEQKTTGHDHPSTAGRYFRNFPA